MTECIQVSFPWAAKNVEARFDSEPLSSDGGLLLIRSVDERLRLPERAASLLEDGRDQSKVRYEDQSLLRQRVYGICAGYEDCNHADSLRFEPLHKLVVGAPLASQAKYANMPDPFLHDRNDFRQLLEITAKAKKIDDPSLVEKDYWIMYCLSGLQQAGLKFELKGGTFLSKGHRK